MKTLEPPATLLPISEPVRTGTAAWRPWLVIFSRTALFAGLQAALATLLVLSGSGNPWETAADWWPFTVSLANLIGIALLVILFRSEGGRYLDLFRIRREHVGGDLLALLAITVLMAPISYLPNVLLGQWLFGDSAATLPLLVRPLPIWAVYTALIAFPVTQGLVELATYFGYAMPRLEEQGLSRWAAVTVPALMLAVQHAAVPVLFDLRFIAWRGLMFIPFALFAGLVIRWRPRLFPYLAIVHVLMDFSFAIMLLDFAY